MGEKEVGKRAEKGVQVLGGKHCAKHSVLKRKGDRSSQQRSLHLIFHQTFSTGLRELDLIFNKEAQRNKGWISKQRKHRRKLKRKPPVIVEYKIVKKGKISTYLIVRVNGSTKRYTSMINLLKNIDREDLETLWKLVQDKHKDTRPEEGYERVLWGDLKVMFEPDVESEAGRQLQGHNVTVRKLFSSSGVHFVRFKNLHIILLVDKVYPLTPATITKMLERKLQADKWNEMCY
nr:hypothetical protein [Tanacetum cinerariifolium]